MKKTMSVLVLFAFIFGSLMILNHETAMAMGKKPKAYPDVKTITKEEFSKKIAAGDPVQVVNVLTPDQYNRGIIKGSKKIPLEELDKRIQELDKTREVVTYCASYKCGASREAARKLAALGFNVRAYEGGIKEWKEAGLPLD